MQKYTFTVQMISTYFLVSTTDKKVSLLLWQLKKVQQTTRIK